MHKKQQIPLIFALIAISLEYCSNKCIQYQQKAMTDTTTQGKTSIPNAQEVTAITHWNERLFSFRVTRPESLRFRSGEFTMIGLPNENGKPLQRAYSIASPSWDEELEFYSIKVKDGPLTSRLKHIKVGDEIIVQPKPVGSQIGRAHV